MDDKQAVEERKKSKDHMPRDKDRKSSYDRRDGVSSKDEGSSRKKDRDHHDNHRSHKRTRDKSKSYSRSRSRERTRAETIDRRSRGDKDSKGRRRRKSKSISRSRRDTKSVSEESKTSRKRYEKSERRSKKNLDRNDRRKERTDESKEKRRSRRERSEEQRNGDSSRKKSFSTERYRRKSRSRSKDNRRTSNRHFDESYGFSGCDAAYFGSTVAIMGLASGVTDKMLSRALEPFHPTDVRLGGGNSTAFADFKNSADAQKLLSSKLMVGGEYVRFELAKQSFGTIRRERERSWDCSKCGGHNFAGRDACYRCSNSRENEGVNRVGRSRDCLSGLDSIKPTNILLLRCLSQNTTEEKIAEKLRIFAPVVAVRVLRDPRSGSSRGTAVVEFGSIEHATHTLNTASVSNELIIDYSEPIITYACIPPSAKDKASQQFFNIAAVEAAAMAAMESEARFRDQERAFGNMGDIRGGPGGLVPALYAAAMKARAAVQTFPAEEAAAEAEIAAAVAKAKAKRSEKQLWPPIFEKAGAAYIYDRGSSYFFESSTGAYYDPKSKLYFIGENWYRHIPNSDPPFTLALPSDVAEGEMPAEKKDSEDANRSNTSNVEKTVSSASKKEKLSFGLKPKLQSSSISRRVVTKQRSHDSSESESEVEDEHVVRALVIPEPMAIESERAVKRETMSLAQAKVEAALQEANDLLSSKPLIFSTPVPQTNYACLLCQRGFVSAEQLKKHEQKSKLHAENLAKQAAGMI